MFSDRRTCCHQPLVNENGPFQIKSRGDLHIVFYLFGFFMCVGYLLIGIYLEGGWFSTMRLGVTGISFMFIGYSVHYIRFTDEGEGMKIVHGPGVCCDRTRCCCCRHLPDPSFQYSEVTEVERETYTRGEFCCRAACDKKNEHGNFFLTCCRNPVEVVAIHTPDKASSNCCIRHTGVSRFDFVNAEDAQELVTFLEGKIGKTVVAI